MIWLRRRHQRKNLLKCESSLRQITEKQRLWILLLRKFLSAYSVCATVARLTPGRLTKFVYIIGWAVLDRNLGFVAAVFWRATEVDFPVNLTTFHSRMSTMQPARAGCTTSKRCHKCCWHFCSSSSYKTIPSIEFPVARLFIRGSMVTVFSLKITQVFVFIARINCKVKWHPYSHQKP